MGREGRDGSRGSWFETIHAEIVVVQGLQLRDSQHIVCRPLPVAVMMTVAVTRGAASERGGAVRPRVSHGPGLGARRRRRRVADSGDRGRLGRGGEAGGGVDRSTRHVYPIADGRELPGVGEADGRGGHRHRGGAGLERGRPGRRQADRLDVVRIHAVAIRPPVRHDGQRAVHISSVARPCHHGGKGKDGRQGRGRRRRAGRRAWLRPHTLKANGEQRASGERRGSGSGRGSRLWGWRHSQPWLARRSDLGTWRERSKVSLELPIG